MFAAILCSNQLKAEISNIIILSMTVAHFYSSTVVGLFSQVGVLFGGIISKVPGLCVFIAFSFVVSCVNGFLSFVLLAFNRLYFML